MTYNRWRLSKPASCTCVIPMSMLAACVTRAGVWAHHTRYPRGTNQSGQGCTGSKPGKRVLGGDMPPILRVPAMQPLAAAAWARRTPMLALGSMGMPN